MKKVISVIIAMAIAMSFITSFAANSASGVDYASVWFDGVDFADTEETDKISAISPNFSQNPENPAVFTVKDGELTMKRAAAEKKAFLYHYFGNVAYAFENYCFGFDFKIDGLTSNTEKTGAILGFYPGLKAVPAGGNTTWCFFGSGKLELKTKFNTETEDETDLLLDESGKPYIYHDKAQLSQGKEYTLKVYVDKKANTFKSVVVDKETGDEFEGTSGKVQAVFDSIYKLETNMLNTVNMETAVTFDNYFLKRTGLTILADKSIVLLEDGNISISAIIPKEYENPALYINDTFVENIETVSGVESYDIKAELPQGTVLGNIKIEIRATENGESVFAVANSKLEKVYRREIAIDAINKGTAAGTDTDGVPYYGPGDTRTSEFNPKLTDGLYEIGFKFKPKSGATTLNMRLRSNNYQTTPGNWSAAGAMFDGYGDAWYPWSITASSKFKNVSADSWNDGKMIVDFRGNAMESAQPYSLTINGITHNGTFKMHAQSTINGFVEIGFNNVYFRDLYLTEIIDISSKSVTALYADETTADYVDEALVSLNLDKLAFKFPVAFDNINNIKFVDENGEDVEDITVSVEGTDVVIIPAEGTTIPTGSYKLLIDKDATFEDVVLGAGIEVPVELSAPGAIFSPADGATITSDEVTVKAFAENADKLLVYENGVEIKEFDTPSYNGMYSFKYTPETSGTKTIDIYVYKGDNVELITSSFVYCAKTQALKQENNFDEKNNSTYLSKGAIVWSEQVDHDDESAYLFYGLPKFNDSVKIDGVSTVIGECTPLGYKCEYDHPDYNGKWRMVRASEMFASINPQKTYRTMVTEYEICPEENTVVHVEVGANTKGKNSTSDGYTTPAGYTGGHGSSVKLFDGEGKFCGAIDYTPGNWYKVTHTIDYVNMRNIICLDGVEVINEAITNKDVLNAAETIVSCQKYRLVFAAKNNYTNTDEALHAELVEPKLYLDNFVRYEAAQSPAIVAIEDGNGEIENGVISSGTDAVTVKFDKAFDALTAADILVTVNGEDATGVDILVADSFDAITVSGIGRAKIGSEIKVTVKNTAKIMVSSNGADGTPAYESVMMEKNIFAQLYVGNINKVCVLPVKVDESGVVAKYINISESDVDTYLVFAQYSGDKLFKTKFVANTLVAGGKGLIKGDIESILSAENYKIMVWDKNLEMLALTVTK